MKPRTMIRNLSLKTKVLLTTLAVVTGLIIGISLLLFLSCRSLFKESIYSQQTPYGEAFKPLYQMSVNILVLLLIGASCTLVVTWYVTNRLILPLNRLTDYVGAISRGEADWQELELHSGDEIEQLARAFNVLMSEIQGTKQLLKQEKEFLSGIIQNAAAPMFVIDQHHKIIFWNNALAKMTGKSSFQMTGTKQQWSAFYSKKRPVLADLVLDHKLQSIDMLYSGITSSPLIDGALRAEGWFDNIGGARRYIFFETAPVKNANNEIIAVIETLEDISERKLAQEAIANHNLFLQEILDAIPNPVFYKDTHGAYIGCNKAFQSFVGLSFDEITGKTIADVMPLRYAEEAKLHDTVAIREKAGYNYETELLRFDGLDRSVLITKAPFFKGNGEIGGIVGAFVDITEQHRLDDQIRKMSQAIEQSPTTILITNIDGDIEYVNPKFCQTTGYTAQEAIGKNPRVLKSGEMSDDEYVKLWKTISSGNEWRGELHNRRKNGTLFWEFASISPLFDKNGVISGYLAVKEDITERKAVEAELLESRRSLEENHLKLELLFAEVEHGKREWEETLDHLRDFIILTDADHRIRRCNKLLADATGRSHSDLMGLDWRELIEEADFNFVTFNGCNGELFHPPTGCTYDITVYPIGDGEHLSGYVVSMNDTTELRTATQELKNAYAELKDAQLQIFQQEKLASIGQLAAGVAHEINNPMGFISSNLTSLGKYIARITEFIDASDSVIELSCDTGLKGPLNEKRKKLKIDFIMNDSRQLLLESLDGAARVRSIVKDLKDFSRVDQLERAPANLNELLATTINIAWNEIKYVAVLDRKFGPIPEILCYPQQLNQVFLNILVNAAHSLGGTKGVITVRTWNNESDVFVAISDTGSGIQENILKRIFEPFFTTKEVGKGTGLGLSISYDIVRKHGGDILVESEIGKGSTFTVRIPLLVPHSSDICTVNNVPEESRL